MPAILRPRLRFRAAIEGIAIGLVLGLIDVHSKDGDWFDVIIAYPLAGFVLGLRHAGRAWQAWIPLGSSLYLMHRVAIACGYQPPYVEDSADSALICVFVVWPVGFALAFGAFVRFIVFALSNDARPRQGKDNPHRPEAGKPGTTGHADRDPGPLRDPTATKTQRTPGPPLTVRRLMFIISLIAVHLAFLRLLLVSDHFFGFGTIYSERYSESAFQAIRVGMTPEEVEAIAGRPLGKVPRNQVSVPGDEEMWYYSKGPDDTANHWRRWVYFEKGKVVSVIGDFWYD